MLRKRCWIFFCLEGPDKFLVWIVIFACHFAAWKTWIGHFIFFNENQMWLLVLYTIQNALSFVKIAFCGSILRHSMMNWFVRLFSCCCRWIAATEGVWQTLQLSRLPNYQLQNRHRTKVAFAYWYIGTGKCWRGKRFSFFRRGLYCNLP